jgi:hypothetical protein
VLVCNIGNERAELRRGDVGLLPKGQEPPPPLLLSSTLSYPYISLAHKITRERTISKSGL